MVQNKNLHLFKAYFDSTKSHTTVYTYIKDVAGAEN